MFIVDKKADHGFMNEWTVGSLMNIIGTQPRFKLQRKITVNYLEKIKLTKSIDEVDCIRVLFSSDYNPIYKKILFIRLKNNCFETVLKANQRMFATRDLSIADIGFAYNSFILLTSIRI